MTLEQLIRDNPALDNAGIVSAWAELPPVTHAAIPLKALEEYLREIGLWAALKQVAADAGTDAAVRSGIVDFLDQVASPRAVNLDTSNERIAVRSAAVLAWLAPVAASLGLVPAEVTAAIYALGGGLAHGTITEADVAAERTRIRVEPIVAAETRWWYDRAQIIEGLLRRDELRTAAGEPLPLATATAEQVREACRRMAMEA